MTLQELDVLFLKRLCLVMLFLVSDVIPNRFDSVITDRKRPITLLPFKLIHMPRRMLGAFPEAVLRAD